MAKVCAACNNKIGLFRSKTKISNGYVCKKCLKKAGIANFENSYSFTCNTAREMIDRRIPLVKSFKATRKYGTILQVDEKNKAFKIRGQLFEYSNLLDYELLEDGQALAIDKIGIGEAAVGGLLLGGVGALVGAVAGTKILAGVCNSMELHLTFRNAHINTIVIPFIAERTSKKSDEYKIAQKNAQSCITALKIIADHNTFQKQPVNANVNVNVNTTITANNEPNNANLSGADEIIKYKTLLDSGIITKKEFEAKKKQILNL